MRIPASASPEIQASFREVWEALDRLGGLQTNFKGVPLSNVGSPVQPFDAATKEYVDAQVKARVTA